MLFGLSDWDAVNPDLTALVADAALHCYGLAGELPDSVIFFPVFGMSVATPRFGCPATAPSRALVAPLLAQGTVSFGPPGIDDGVRDRRPPAYWDSGP